MAQPKLPPAGWRGTTVDLLVLAGLWSLAVFIINPSGEFPLNDDWSMSRSVKLLVEQGVYQPSGWTAMTLITHVLWGSLFCLPYGFSFMALRISTLALSLVGVLGIYLLIRQLNRPRWLAMIVALALCFNPIYFSLSNTFMTDVPFTAWEILAGLFFVRFLQREKHFDLWIATALAIAGLLSRQLGVAIPLAFGAAFLFKHHFQKPAWLRAILPAIVSVTAMVVFNHWLRASGKAADSYNVSLDLLVGKIKHPLTLPLNVAHYGWAMLMYFGCFLLPLFAVIPFCRPSAGIKPPKTIWLWLALAGFLLLTVARYLLRPALMPVHLNVLDSRGIGPFTLRDTQLMELPHVPSLPVHFWMVVTLFSFVGAGLLIAVVVKTVQRLLSEYRLRTSAAGPVDDHLQNTLTVFFLTSTLIYLGPLLINGFFDRYLLTAFVFLAVFVVAAAPAVVRPSARRHILGLLLVAGLAIYAVAGTKDYLEWNRVRWQALADLQGENISPAQIDGGFEFNGWLFYDAKYHSPAGMSGWWVKDDEYLLSFGELTGFSIYREYKYQHWLPPYTGKILVLKRQDDAAAIRGKPADMTTRP